MGHRGFVPGTEKARVHPRTNPFLKAARHSPPHGCVRLHSKISKKTRGQLVRLVVRERGGRVVALKYCKEMARPCARRLLCVGNTHLRVAKQNVRGPSLRSPGPNRPRHGNVSPPDKSFFDCCASFSPARLRAPATTRARPPPCGEAEGCGEARKGAAVNTPLRAPLQVSNTNPSLSDSDRGGWCLTPGGFLRGPPCGGVSRVPWVPKRGVALPQCTGSFFAGRSLRCSVVKKGTRAPVAPKTNTSQPNFPRLPCINPTIPTGRP